MASLTSILQRAVQNTIIVIARPYIFRELPGWGSVYTAIVGDYRRDWLWTEAPAKTIRGKLHHYFMPLDLSRWADRSTFFLGRWYDLHTQLLMSDLIKSGDTVVDIGANHGMFALVASHLVGAGGKVICFEPNPSCQKILDEAIQLNGITNVTVHRVGLGEKEAELTLSVPRFNSGEGTFGSSNYDAATTYQVRAQVKVGDRMLTGETPAFIKIDVEGFECSVLAGLNDTLARYRPAVLTEIVPRHLKNCGSSVDELVKLMTAQGYRGFQVDLAKDHGGYSWRLSQFDPHTETADAIWLHRDFIEQQKSMLLAHGLKQ
jgi:FkbM family methyltransferase